VPKKTWSTVDTVGIKREKRGEVLRRKQEGKKGVPFPGSSNRTRMPLKVQKPKVIGGVWGRENSVKGAFSKKRVHNFISLKPIPEKSNGML